MASKNRDGIKIYYFSGTGNSLAVARDVCRALEGTLIPIPDIIHRQTCVDPAAEVIGIVFPVYYETCGGLPLIVRRFVSFLTNIETSYIFGICTYGSGMFAALSNLGKLIETRGGILSARIAVNMPANLYPGLVRKKQPKMLATWKQNIATVSNYIVKRKKGSIQLPNLIAGPFYPVFRLLGPLLLYLYKNVTIRELRRYSGSDGSTYEELLPRMDGSFTLAPDKCISCGTCEEICPVHNIVLENGGPVWQHRCEFCLACYHWCPVGAIDSTAVKGALRYHHPEVSVDDIKIRS